MSSRAARSDRSLARELARPPNLASLVRVPLALAALALRSSPLALGALVVVAAASDLLDGWLARRSGRPNPIGAWLDPVCDKAFFVGIALAIAIASQPPWWILVLAATRELLVVPGTLLAAAIRPERTARAEYRALPSGKMTTVAQFGFLTALLVGRPELAVVAAATASVLGAIAAAEYALRFLALPPPRDAAA